MKKLFSTIILSLLLGASTQAQDYIPVIQEGSFWDVSSTGPGVCTYINRYRVGSDFTHNGKTYKNIETAPVRGDDNPNDLCLPSGTQFVNESDFTASNSYLREDITERKVYILIETGSNTYEEYTMADYTLEVGDKLTNAYSVDINGTSSMGNDLTVVSIDTNSQGRKRYFLEDGGEWYEEGIGSYQGPIQIYRPYVLYDDVNTISCTGNDTTNNSSCAAVLSTRDYQLSQINVFPNPTSDKISLTNLENNTFKLYSILGKEMNYQFSEQTQQIDISHLRAGIYLLEIRGTNDAKRVVKILKN